MAEAALLPAAFSISNRNLSCDKVMYSELKCSAMSAVAIGFGPFHSAPSPFANGNRVGLRRLGGHDGGMCH